MLFFVDIYPQSENMACVPRPNFILASILPSLSLPTTLVPATSTSPPGGILFNNHLFGPGSLHFHPIQALKWRFSIDFAIHTLESPVVTDFQRSRPRSHLHQSCPSAHAAFWMQMQKILITKVWLLHAVPENFPCRRRPGFGESLSLKEAAGSSREQQHQI